MELDINKQKLKMILGSVENSEEISILKEFGLKHGFDNAQLLINGSMDISCLGSMYEIKNIAIFWSVVRKLGKEKVKEILQILWQDSLEEQRLPSVAIVPLQA